MKLLLACFLIAIAIFLFRLMRRSTAKEYAPVDTPDPIQAITQLAEEGNVHAQYKLAGLCCNKEPKDYRKAVHWYMKAAEQGHLDAQCLLIKEYSSFLTNSSSRSDTCIRQKPLKLPNRNPSEAV